NYWSKLLILIIIIIGAMFIFLCRDSCPVEEVDCESCMTVTTSPRVMSKSVVWRDSVCKIILDELALISAVCEDGDTMIQSREELAKLLEKDTLVVDSLLYIQLRKNRVVPQYRIDSIYEGKGINGLLSSFFDDVWFIPQCSTDSILTQSEQRYVIYILQQHGFSARIDCESGCLYIIKAAISGRRKFD
ncbi:hypothetical protein, partial [Bacteroides heparinolyticus]